MTLQSLHRGTYATTGTRPDPKTKPYRSEEYRRAVAKLPCINCCKTGPSQCAHANAGKGMATKTDDRTAFPLCPNCHRALDQGALFAKQDRRDKEAKWGEQTRAVIRGMGWWPVAAPMWEEA